MNQSASDSPHSFAHRMALLRQGEHLCSIYSDTGEMLTQVIPYLKAGLLNRERCIYVMDEHKQDVLVQALKFWRIDADAAMNSGQLVFWTRENYRQPGPFDLTTMISFVTRTRDQALADGYSGIRLGVEMSWTLNNGVSDEDLVRWEDFLNTISYAGSQVSFICQYNGHLLTSAVIANAVRVHPVIVLGQEICPNRYPRTATQVLTAIAREDLESLLAKIKLPSDDQERVDAVPK